MTERFYSTINIRLFSLATVFVFLISFIGSIPAWAQTPPVTKDLGTSPSSLLFGSSMAKKTQLLYLPGDLAPQPSGISIIEKIHFQYAATGTSTTLTDINIKLGQTMNTGFSPTNTFYTNLFTVFSDVSYTIPAGVAQDWFTIPLTTPFPYNPNQTLIVEVSWAGSSSSTFTTATSPGSGKKLYTNSVTNTTGITTNTAWQDFGITIPVPGTDVSFTDITASANSCFTATETVTATITNTGTTNINFANTPATFNVNVTGPNSTSFPAVLLNSGTLATGTSTIVTISTNYNMSAPGTYNFGGSVTMVPPDVNAANNTLTNITVVNTPSASLPQTVDFTGFNGSNLTSGFPGWSEATSAPNPIGNSSAWASASGLSTSSNVTAKLSMSSNSKNEWILSPKFIPGSATGFRFKAAVTAFNSTNATLASMNDDKFQVLISTDCGNSFTPVYTIDASTGLTNNLSDHFVSLAGYNGQPIILAVFATEGTITGSSSYDLHVDDFFIGTVSPTDVGISGLIQPFSGKGCYTNSENIVVELKNYGVGAFDFGANNTTITVQPSFNGNPLPALTTTLTNNSLNGGNPLPMGATIQIPVGVINMSQLGNYTFNAYTTVITGGSDPFASNDAMTPVNITVSPPQAGTASASATSLCQSGFTTLNLTGNDGGIVQWQKANVLTRPFSDIPGANTAVFTLTSAINQTSYFRASISCGSNVSISNTITVNVQNPQVINNTPDTRCGSGIVNLIATPQPGTTINWYETPTGGSVLATGNTFSPIITTSKIFYAEATTGSDEIVGKTSTIGSGGKNSGGGLLFDAQNPFVLRSVVVYSDLTTGGNLVIDLKNAGGTQLGQVSYSLPPASGITAFTVPLNLNVPAGIGLRLELGAPLSLYRDVAGVSFPYVSPSGNVTITNGTIAGNYYFFYNWVISTGCAGTRVPVTATVNPLPVVNLGADIEQCVSSVTLNAGNAGSTFKWYRDNNLIFGATSQTYTATVSGKYVVSVTSTNSCTATDTVNVTLNPNPAIPIVSLSGPSTICQGQTITLTASAATGVNYQWLLNGVAIGGANTPSYVASTSGTYSVRVQTAAGCLAVSANNTITVNPLPAKPTFIASSSSTCQGQSIQLTVNSTITGLTFSWLRNGSPIAGATSSTYAATQTGAYKVIATNASGCKDTSTAQTITINPLPAKPTISPAGPITVCQGTPVLLTATSATSGVNFNWVKDGILIPGGASASLNVIQTGNYRAIAINQSTGCQDTSVIVSVTVNPQPGKPLITATGGSTTFCQGSSVFLSASNITPSASYKWLLNGLPITGATNTSYTATLTGDYRIVAVLGTCSDTSNTITVTVNPNPVKPIITVNGSLSVCQGGSVLLTGSSTSPLVTYQWLRNGSVITNAILPTYTATLAGDYQVIAKLNSCSTISDIVTVVVNPKPIKPTITAASSVNICQGNFVTLTGATSTLNVDYRWSLNGILIAGATAAIYNATVSGDYRVIVTTKVGGCPDSSAVTKVIVNPNPIKPVITANGPTTFCTGQSVKLLGPAAGNGITYKWLLNNSPITGATDSVYYATLAGNYRLVSTLGSCTDTSNTIAVTLIPLPVAPIIKVNVTTSEVILTINPVTGASYQWYKVAWDGKLTAIPGATETEVKVEASGQYTIKITTSCESLPATLVHVQELATPVMRLDVYPNPTDGNLTVDFVGFTGKTAEVFIYSMKGQLVLRKSVELHSQFRTQESFNLNGLAGGIYSMKVVSGNQTMMERIIIK